MALFIVVVVVGVGVVVSIRSGCCSGVVVVGVLVVVEECVASSSSSTLSTTYSWMSSLVLNTLFINRGAKCFDWRNQQEHYSASWIHEYVVLSTSALPRDRMCHSQPSSPYSDFPQPSRRAYIHPPHICFGDGIWNLIIGLCLGGSKGSDSVFYSLTLRREYVWKIQDDSLFNRIL